MPGGGKCPKPRPPGAHLALSEHTVGHQPHQDTQQSWTKVPPTQWPALELLAAGMGTAMAWVTSYGGRSPESISCSMWFVSSPDPCQTCFRFFWNLGTSSIAGVMGWARRTETTFFHRKLQVKINIFGKIKLILYSVAQPPNSHILGAGQGLPGSPRLSPVVPNPSGNRARLAKTCSAPSSSIRLPFISDLFMSPDGRQQAGSYLSQTN